MAVPSGDNKGPCYWCFKTVKWIPVLFIVTIVAWSYYAYVIQLCLCKYLSCGSIYITRFTFSFLVTVESSIKKAIYLIFYHIFFFMFCWSYWQTIFTDIGRVPSKVRILIF